MARANGAKRVTQRKRCHTLSPASRIQKGECEALCLWSLKEKENNVLKTRNVIQSQRDKGIFLYSCLAIFLKESQLGLYFQGQFEKVIAKYID